MLSTPYAAAAWRGTTGTRPGSQLSDGRGLGVSASDHENVFFSVAVSFFFPLFSLIFKLR